MSLSESITALQECLIDVKAISEYACDVIKPAAGLSAILVSRVIVFIYKETKLGITAHRLYTPQDLEVLGVHLSK